MATIVATMFSFLSGVFTQYLCYAKRPQKWTNKANANATSEGEPKIEEAEQYRQDASVHAAARGKLMTESQAAFKMGDKKKAKELADKGKAEGHEMDRLNSEAATIFFNHNNPREDGSNNYGLVDLHGLHVKEALMYAELSIQNELERIIDEKTPDAKAGDEDASPKQDSVKTKSRQVIFIVGMGNHSEGGIRKIKPALEEMIKEKYPTFKMIDDKPHKGCILVRLSDQKRRSSYESNGNSGQEKKEKSSCVIA